MADTCDLDGCEYDAVFDTRRCLQHAEPVTSHGATAVTAYHGAYDRARVPAATTPPQPPAPVPAAVPARPYDDEPGASDRCGPHCRAPELCLQPEHQPGPLRLAADLQLDPAALERWYREFRAALMRPVQPVGFDEAPARGWLARALRRLFA